MVAATCSKVTFSSWSPSSALVAGVKIGSGSREPSTRPAGSGHAAHRAARAVLGEPRAGEVAAGDALHRVHVEPPHEHGAAGHGVGHRPGDEVVGHEVGELVEPPQRQLGQHTALVGDRRGQHVVVGRDAVARDDEQVAAAAVLGLVEVADLAGVDVPVTRQLGRGRDVRDHAGTSAAAAAMSERYWPPSRWMRASASYAVARAARGRPPVPTTESTRPPDATTSPSRWVGAGVQHGRARHGGGVVQPAQRPAGLGGRRVAGCGEHDRDGGVRGPAQRREVGERGRWPRRGAPRRAASAGGRARPGSRGRRSGR